MRITLYLLILMLAITEVKAQAKPEGTKASAQQGKFKNQGEQEDYWAEQLFKNNYQKQEYTRFTGPIQFTDKITLMFGQKFFGVHSVPDSLMTIFTRGLLHPDLFGIGITITAFHELKFLSSDPAIRRYKFWVFYAGMANPQVFFIELTNKNASEETDLQTFLKGATLTFLKDAWIVI